MLKLLELTRHPDIIWNFHTIRSLYLQLILNFLWKTVIIGKFSSRICDFWKSNLDVIFCEYGDFLCDYLLMVHKRTSSEKFVAVGNFWTKFAIHSVYTTTKKWKVVVDCAHFYLSGVQKFRLYQKMRVQKNKHFCQMEISDMTETSTGMSK